LGWLERVPTYKEALENVKDKDLHNYGFLGYPVLQTADIVIYSKEGTPLLVPVGEDQVSHVEISREIVRRFDEYFSVRFSPSLYDTENYTAWRVMERPLAGPYAPPSATPVTMDEIHRIESGLRQKILEVGRKNLLT